MKFTQLKQDIASGAKSIYLLQGNDAYFLTHAEDMIKKAFLEFPELNFTAFEGDNIKGAAIKTLTDALQAYPFMSGYRVVKVSEFYPTESDWEKFMRPLMENFPATAILIIVNSKAKKSASDTKSKGGASYADIKRKGGVTYVDCGVAEEEDVTRWIYLTLKRAGIYADVSVCKSIAQYCLFNMSRVALETEKIIIYKGEGTLTQEETDDLVYKDADYRVYELTNAVAAGNYDAFITIADDLFGKGMDEVFILNALFNFFRTLTTVAASDKTAAELAEELGMKEYGVKRSREQARKLGIASTSALCSSIYSMLSGIKQGNVAPKNAFYIVTAQIFFGE